MMLNISHSLLRSLVFISLKIILLKFSSGQEFEFVLYFEDVLGNRDTLSLGYDANATTGIDISFGEKDIFYEEWDDTLEVRIFNNRYSDFFDSLISATKRQFNPNQCTNTSNPYISSIGMKCKHYPLKLSWNRNLFNNDCLKNSLVTDWYPGAWFDSSHGGEQGPFYFKEADSCLFTHTTHKYYSKEHGTLDLLYITLANSFQSHTYIKHEDFIDPIVSVYPNPTSDKLYINTTNTLSIESIEIFDINGKSCIKKLNSKQIDLKALPDGIYLYRISLINNDLFNGIILKSAKNE